MRKKIPCIIATDYAYLAPYYINGDTAFLEPEDDRHIDMFLEYVSGFEPVFVKGDEYFGRPECGGLAGEVIDYVCIKRGKV